MTARNRIGGLCPRIRSAGLFVGIAFLKLAVTCHALYSACGVSGINNGARNGKFPRSASPNPGHLIGRRKLGVISLGNGICSSIIEGLQGPFLHVTG